jgi:dCMP deaminase
MNAILNKNCSDLEGMRIYTTLFPCNECAKLIVQSRIKEVVYLSDAQAHKDPFKASRRILDLAGVASWQHKPFAPRIVVDFEDDLARVRKKAK